MTDLTLAEQHLVGRDSTTGPAPLSVYCYTCNVTIRKGELASRFDAATFTHVTCPSSPHRTFAPHKYGTAK